MLFFLRLGLECVLFELMPPSEPDPEDVDLDSALIWAIRYLETATVEEMLAEGWRAIFSVARGHRIHRPSRARAGMAQKYLDCGLHEVATGERDSKEDQRARLHIAQLLLQCGADPDNRQHGCGGTPLHHTLAGGYLELVKFLLDAKADVNAANRYGARRRRRPRRSATRTHTTPDRRPFLLLAGVHPLHIAVKREYDDCIEYLMNCE